MAKTTLEKIAGAMDTTPYKKKAVDWVKKQEPEDLLNLMMAPVSPFAAMASGRKMGERASTIPGGTSSKAMSDMLQTSKPLPGQAIAIAPDPEPADPRAVEFQQAVGSMMATPDDYYRWERDQRIAEQDAKQTKADAEWDGYLDKTLEKLTKAMSGAGQAAWDKETARKNNMEAAMRASDKALLDAGEEAYWNQLIESKKKDDYSNHLINQPVPDDYVYNRDQGWRVADEVMMDPSLHGANPEWYSDWLPDAKSPLEAWISGEAAKEPGFRKRISTKQFWDELKKFDEDYQEWEKSQ